MRPLTILGSLRNSKTFAAGRITEHVGNRHQFLAHDGASWLASVQAKVHAEHPLKTLATQELQVGSTQSRSAFLALELLHRKHDLVFEIKKEGILAARHP